MNIIREQNKISANELAEKLGISLRAVEKNIAKLKDAGIIRRIGPDKGGHWEFLQS